MNDAMALCIESFVNQIDKTAERFDKQYIFSINMKVKDDENETMQSFVATDMDDLYFGALMMAMDTFVDMQRRANETMGANDFFKEAPTSKRLRHMLKEVETVKEHFRELEHLVRTYEQMNGA
jgi:hypothetical protein